MRGKTLRLTQSKKNRKITAEKEGEFFALLQTGLLSALLESGFITERQFYMASEKLKTADGGNGKGAYGESG